MADPKFAHFKDAPPPWPLKADVWVFVTSKASSGETLPDNYFDNLTTTKGVYKSGPGTIMLVRYQDTSVGPYDELMIIPGIFENPTGTTPKKSTRISRIYVSTLYSVYNGRRNWNIPKHLAKFDFKPSETVKGATEVRVYNTIPETVTPTSSTFAESPFFAALIKPVFWPLPAIPLNINWSPIPFIVVQPPLSSSANPEQDGLIGTDDNQWRSIDVSDFKGKVKPVKIEGLIEQDDPETKKRVNRVADGKGFPQVVPWKIGFHWAEARISFPHAVIIPQKKD